MDGYGQRVYSCLIVENEPLAIRMIEDCIAHRADLEVAGIATELAELKEMVGRFVPDIIFLDFIIPPGNAQGFHFGMLPKSSSIVVISAIPPHQFDGAQYLSNPYELLKPVSIAAFDRCMEQVIADRNEE